MAGWNPSTGEFSYDTQVAQTPTGGMRSVTTSPTGAIINRTTGALRIPKGMQADINSQNLQNKALTKQLEMQQQLFSKLFGGGGGGGGVLDTLLGGFGFGGGGAAGGGGGAAVQPGFPDTGVGPGFNIPGMPGYGGEGPMPPPVGGGASQPGFAEDPGLGMPITQHGGGGISAVPGMQPFGQGRRNQLSEDFNNLAKSAQTMLVQRGFGGSSAVPDTFAEIGKQKNLSMMELEDSLFREQLQFRAAERAPMFSILQSLLGGIF